MNITARLQGQAAARGFTLIELLLTVVLLLILIGAMVFNFSGAHIGAQLEEGAEQLESAIRFARAHAANTGCRVRLSFEEQVEDGAAVPLGNIFVTWEPDPLGRPGVYEPLREVEMLLQGLLQMVEVDDVLPFGAAAPAASSEAAAFEEETDWSFAPITFYPDGSSDSAEIILAARSEEETRRISVMIVGTTGVIRKTLLTDAASADEQEFIDALSE